MLHIITITYIHFVFKATNCMIVLIIRHCTILGIPWYPITGSYQAQSTWPLGLIDTISHALLTFSNL